MIADEGEGAKYWPRWRGPSGQGLAGGTGYPDTWSATQNVLWKTPVPGNGNSSPIVWGDRIFVTTANDGGRRLSLLAYRRSDGRLLWEAAAPTGRTDSGSHYKNGHASATPATDGERVYVSFGARGLVRVRLQREARFGSAISGRWTRITARPARRCCIRDRIILYQDQFSDSFIAAFDTRTGRELWRTRRNANVGWGTPIAIRAAGSDEVIVNSQQWVHSYDPASGKELWRCGGTTYEVIPTPVVGYGLVFCSSGRAGPTLAIKPGGSGDVTRTHLAWESPRGSPFVPSPILYGEQLYMVNDMASIVTSLAARAARSCGRDDSASRSGKDFPRRRWRWTGRSSSPMTMARRSCYAPARRSRSCASTGLARRRSPRRRSSTDAGTSGPIAISSRLDEPSESGNPMIDACVNRCCPSRRPDRQRSRQIAAIWPNQTRQIIRIIDHR